MAKKITVEELRKLPPEKRMEILKRFEEKRKQEIERAEDLIRGTEKELEKKEETEREIEEKSRELLEEKAEEEAGEELENIVEEAQEGAEEAEAAKAQYGAPLEEIRRVYEIATPDTYDRIRELRDRAAEGRLSEEERKAIDFYQGEFSSVSTVQAAYVNDDTKRINIMKAKTALEQIKKYETMM